MGAGETPLGSENSGSKEKFPHGGSIETAGFQNAPGALSSRSKATDSAHPLTLQNSIPVLL